MAGAVVGLACILVLGLPIAAQEPIAEPTAADSPIARNSLQPAALPSDWQGSAGVRVVVTDEAGDPLPDVDVLLRLEAQSNAGTLLLRTDTSGLADAKGLAAGEWQVDLRREGYMILTAYLRLEPAKDPKVGFSSRQRTGTFWAPLSAVFLPVDLPVSAAVKTGRDSPKEARKAQRQAVKTARAEEERRRKQQRRGTLALVVEDPDAEAKAAAREARRREQREAKEAERAAAAAREAAARATEVAAREQRRREAQRLKGRMATVVEEADADAADLAAGADDAVGVEVEAPAGAESQPARSSSPAGVESSSEAATAPELEPTANEIAALPDEVRESGAGESPSGGEALLPTDQRLPARLLPNPRLLPAGACPECRPGEVSVHTEVKVAKAGAGGTSAPCSRTLAADLPPLARVVAAGLDVSHRDFAGSLFEEDGNDVLRLLPGQARSQVDKVASQLRDEANSCVALGVVLPAGAEYIGFRYQAGERGVLAECLLGQECQIGRAQWIETPIVTATESVTLVHAVFENRSTQRSRTARLVVYFRPARGWLPPN